MIDVKQKPPTIYTCKECGVEVKREGDEFKRQCLNRACDAPIIASLHATAYGESKVAS